MKITNVKFAHIGESPVIRISTDEGVYGLGQVEHYKPYLRPHMEYYKEMLIGEDPCLVELTMSRIRRFGGFKPWGSAVSAIEHALWDIAGKAAGLPVHRLLGGKVRDKVRVYNGARQFRFNGFEPEDFAEQMRQKMTCAEGFTIMKQWISFHSPMPRRMPDFFYGELSTTPELRHPNRGLLTERALKHIIECVIAMKEVLGDGIGLCLDCGPGWMVPDAIRFARALEPYNIMWLEDMITGDYTPYVLADLYAEVTRSTSTPTHTGEQIYLRQNYKDLIERKAVRVIGPDPCDVGGIAELKWIAEYADMHGILVAPHGVGNGALGLAALVQMAATLPQNYIAFEYPVAREDWWYDIITGLPNPIVKNGFIDVWDTPGMGVDIIPEAALPHMRKEDQDFFKD